VGDAAARTKDTQTYETSPGGPCLACPKQVSGKETRRETTKRTASLRQDHGERTAAQKKSKKGYAGGGGGGQDGKRSYFTYVD